MEENAVDYFKNFTDDTAMTRDLIMFVKKKKIKVIRGLKVCVFEK